MIEQNHEYYVSLEVAKLLKEAGFDWEGKSYYQGEIFYPYSVDREHIVIMNHNSVPDYMKQYSAPTLDVAQRWLREVKHLDISIDYDPTIKSQSNQTSEDDVCKENFYTYEEAQEIAIEEALVLILEKGW